MTEALRAWFAPADDDLPPAPRSRRDRTVDATLLLVAFALGAIPLVSNIEHGLDGPALVVDVVFGSALCVALWWRRRWPVALALAAVPILAISSLAGFAGLILLYTVTALRRWQAAAVVAALQVAVLPIQQALNPQGDWLISYYPDSTLCIAVAVVLGLYRRGRRQTQLERRGRAEAEELVRIEQIRHAERERIAREMHDVLAHRISLLSLHAGALEFRPEASSEEVAQAAAVIRASAHQALEDLRAMIGFLRDGTDGQSPQPPQPTLAVLPVLLEESRTAGMDLEADVRIGDFSSVPDAVGRNAFRIVQEALTNARKHAPSAVVDLRIDGSPGAGLTIDVCNHAPVLAAAASAIPGSGTGLVGLAERATLSGGRLEHGLDEHGDFRVRAWLPWPA
ncbi:MAG: sensor histidine kinase [Gaiellaceae bacterium]